MKIKICIEGGCKNTQTTQEYCRLHYVKNWKFIKEKAQKKAAEKLNKYVEGICKKFPEKYVDVIRKDVRSGGESSGESESPAGGGQSEDFISDMNFHDEGVDRLLSRIKLDRDF